MKIIILLLMVALPAGLACSEDPLDFFSLDGLSVGLSENNTLRFCGRVINRGIDGRGVQLRIKLVSVKGNMVLDEVFWISTNIPPGRVDGFDIPIGALSVKIIESRMW